LALSVTDTLKTLDYVAIQRGTDRTDPRVYADYEQSGLIDTFDSDLADTVMAGFEPSTDRRTTVARRERPDATPALHRPILGAAEAIHRRRLREHMNDEPVDFVEANYQGNLQRLRRLNSNTIPRICSA